MPVIEVAGEYGSVDDRFLHNIFGKAFKHRLLQTALLLTGKVKIDIRPLNCAVVAGIFRAAVIIHSRPFLGLPLVAHIKLASVMVILLVEVAGPDCKAGVRLTILVHSLGISAVKIAIPPLEQSAFVEIGAEPPQVAFHSHKDRLIRVQLKFFGLLMSRFQNPFASLHILGHVAVPVSITVIQEDGVGYLPLFIIFHPVLVIIIERILI